MPSASLLAWLFTRSLLLPHEPATMSLAPPGEFGASASVAGLVETTIAAVTSDRFDASGTGTAIAPKIGAYDASWTYTDVPPRRSRHHESAQARHAARVAGHGGPRQLFDHDRAQPGRDERDGHAARSRAAAARQLRRRSRFKGSSVRRRGRRRPRRRRRSRRCDRSRTRASCSAGPSRVILPARRLRRG